MFASRTALSTLLSGVVGFSVLFAAAACTSTHESAAPIGTIRHALIGDSILDDGEQCDDGNTWGGDGCDALGQIEAGWSCVNDGLFLPIANGALEEPSGNPEQPCPPGNQCFNLTGTLITGFTIDTGNADYVNNSVTPSDWRCSHSNGCADLSGDRRGSMYQDVVSVPGRTYTVHFDLASNAGGTKNMAMSAANGALPPFLEQHYATAVNIRTPAPGPEYDRASFTFTATSTLTRLRFIGTDPNASGVFVDNLVAPPSTCSPSTCGNGALDGGETCDDGNGRSGDGCSNRCQTEFAYQCDTPGAACKGICGDGIKTRSEGCDDGNTTAGDGCSATCAVEAGFNCAFANVLDFNTVCNATTCGDGVVEVPAEHCDDSNTEAGDGCSATCGVEPGYQCVGQPSTCTTVCGDGVIAGDETCDDDNGTPGDGCSASCAIEAGYQCTGTPSACVVVCGDGLIVGAETCDDGNAAAGDGCSATCVVEAGYQCAGTPSVCEPNGTPVCGDGAIAGSEACDDGNTTADDGCSAACAVEQGFECEGSPSVCTPIVANCGNGRIDDGETCDDGNTLAGDGCDGLCQLETPSGDGGVDAGASSSGSSSGNTSSGGTSSGGSSSGTSGANGSSGSSARCSSDSECGANESCASGVCVATEIGGGSCSSAGSRGDLGLGVLIGAAVLLGRRRRYV